MEISRKSETSSADNRQVTVSRGVFLTLDQNNRLTNLKIIGVFMKLPKSRIEIPIQVTTEVGNVTIEDLETNPMSLVNRWGILKDVPDYKLSDHQERFIITLGRANATESYIIPKVLDEDEPIVQVTIGRSQIPFTIKVAEVGHGEIHSITPQSPKEQSKILLCTQILGHVQDAANVMRWAQRNGTLQDKWRFALPATQRTEVTKSALREEGIPVDELATDWSYSGGKDFETGLEYREDFTKPESASTVVAFVAANARLCADVAKGKFAIVSTNFRSEAQLMKRINSCIMTIGITHTFLAGKLKDHLSRHDDMPRLTSMLQSVQNSLDRVPERVIALGGDVKYIDYYWKLCNQKIQMLNVLLYRTFNFNPDFPSKIDTTQVIQIPEIPNLEVSKEKAREYISSVIGRRLGVTDKIVILAGESDDGAFSKRVQEVFKFVSKRPNVHVIMPLNRNDQRIAGLDIPENVHTIGFRKDWSGIISGGDVTFIRGSWGEMRDLIISGTVPVITSFSRVPGDADLDTTQFLTQISEERACNMSLLIKALQANGVDSGTINRLLVDFDNPLDYYTLQEAIEYALQPDVASKIRAAFSNIPRDIKGWVGKIHEQLLDQKRPISVRELSELQQEIWM